MWTKDYIIKPNGAPNIEYWVTHTHTLMRWQHTVWIEIVRTKNVPVDRTQLSKLTIALTICALHTNTNVFFIATSPLRASDLIAGSWCAICSAAVYWRPTRR